MKSPEISRMAPKALLTGQTVMLDVEAVRVSPFEPQARRRARFLPEKIKQLGESILRNGLIQPITVRMVEGLPEIVCGEGRFLATKLEGFKQIEAIVKNLSDEVAIEMQIDENMQRNDLHPLDEANTYAFLMRKYNMSLADLAAKFSQRPRYIAERLKLNDLIEEFQKDLNEGILPIGQAIELAKYPAEAQKRALEEDIVFQWEDRDNGYLTLSELKEELERRLLLDLKHAKFDITDAALVPERGACVDCPEQTGFHPNLFDVGTEKDIQRHCLNQNCLENKTQVFIQITREFLTKKLREKTGDEKAEIMLVSENWSNPETEAPCRRENGIKSTAGKKAGSRR